MSIRYTKGLPIVSKMAEATCSRYELGARKRRVPRRGTSPPGTENFVEDTPGGYLYNICVAKKIIWPIFTYDTRQELLFFISLKPREAVEK